MIARPRTAVKALYQQHPDGRFTLRLSDAATLYEGAPGEKLDRLAERALAGRPALKMFALPFEAVARASAIGL